MDLKISLIGGLLLIVTIIYQTIAEEDKIKIKLVFDKFDKIKEDENVLKTDLTFHKEDDVVKIDGQVEQFVDLNEEYILNITTFHSTEKDGQYEIVLAFTNFDICIFMKKHYNFYLYDTLKDHCNAPDPSKCPVTKETYVVENYPLDTSKFDKFLSPGYYKIESNLMHKEEEILHYTLEAHTEEE